MCDLKDFLRKKMFYTKNLTKLPDLTVWFGSEVILVCGISLLVELPADQRAWGGGVLT